MLLSAVLGAMVGSFLNVCIHRLPRELSVRHPVRSFCPGCQRTIPWFENVPILSILLLRGRCSGCGCTISKRYVAVEILTSVLFAGAAWRLCGSDPSLMIPYGVFLSLLIVGTFVDLEHMIIPDEVTWGGVAMGLGSTLIWPSLHAFEAEDRLLALGRSAVGAFVGYGLLWMVVELGRLVFGKQRLRFATPLEVIWTRTGDAAELNLGGEILDWASLFPRGSERVRMEIVGGSIDQSEMTAGEAFWEFERLLHANQSVDLNQVNRVVCRVNSVVLPREVMGYGDVKFLAAIGAFIGWKGALFSVFSGCFLGALFGMAALLIGKREWSSKIPFGPYLATGALFWLAAGPELWRAYWSALNRFGG